MINWSSRSPKLFLNKFPSKNSQRLLFSSHFNFPLISSLHNLARNCLNIFSFAQKELEKRSSLILRKQKVFEENFSITFKKKKFIHLENFSLEREFITLIDLDLSPRAPEMNFRSKKVFL